VATTVVSSTLLAHLAELRGIQYAETLTGFKWIANAAIDAAAEGVRFVLGFEEALGYSAGDVVRDKDGVSAALLIMDLAAWCRARDTTLAAHLDAVYEELGYAASLQHSLKLPGAAGKARIDAAMDRLRSSPPQTLGKRRLVRLRDLRSGVATTIATGETTPLRFPQSNVLVFDLDGGARVVARPSGTEPKLKFYVEVRTEVAPGELARARKAADKALKPLLNAVLTASGLD
jgi:phosphomannomutase